MFDDIIGKKKEKVTYACHCSICDNVFRRDDYDVLFSVMSEHFIGKHGRIPKDCMIIEIRSLSIPPRQLPEGFTITYVDTVDESLKDILNTEIENGR
jgi:hypothetical protein